MKHPLKSHRMIIQIPNSNSANFGAFSPDVRKSSQSLESPRGSIFSNTAISQHLRELGYPERSIVNLLKCGTPNGIEIIKSCQCSTDIVEMSYRCNLRTCPVCSSKRKRRIRRQFLPKLESLPTNRNAENLYFLTISPSNYPDFITGLKHIRQSFNKFLRIKYIKDRVQAGLWVVETKNHNNKGWNVHIHAVIYGRRLDNQIRGVCRCCGQNLLKYDYKADKLYCANRNCLSTNVERIGQPKVLGIWEKCSKGKANIHISQLNSASFTLNYMLKYISANKDDFDRIEDVAFYIKHTRKQKLLNSFGFLRLELKYLKEVWNCRKCKTPLVFTFDLQIISQIKSDKARREEMEMLEKLKENPNCILKM